MSNPATQFKPGVVTNPNGRPKGARSFTTKVREALEKLYEGTETTAERALVESILHNAIKKRDVQAQRMVWGYLDGLPQQKIDMTSGGEKIFTPEHRDLVDNVMGNFLNVKDSKDNSGDSSV